MKRCSSHPRCFPNEPAELPETEFNLDLGRPAGVQSSCRRCKQRLRKASSDRLRAARLQAQSPPDEFEITIVEPSPLAAAQTDAKRPLPTAAEAPPSTSERLEIARLRRQVEQLRQYARELEGGALDGDAMRALLGSLGAPNVSSDPEWLAGAKRPRSTTGTAVLFVSDVHFDEVVNPSEIGGCNEYNRDVATRRLRNVFRHSIGLLKGYMARPTYDGIVCALGGDLVSGNIHDELVETNAATINETMIALEALLIEGLGALADEFGKVHVPCVTGNHGRMHKKPRAKQRAVHNYEWAIYQRIAGYFRSDSRLTFQIPDGAYAQFQVYRRRVRLEHGDAFRGGNGIGGIMVPIQRGLAKRSQVQVAIGEPFDVAMIGHWHQYIHMGGLVINGSTKGYDEYAAQNGFGFEPPQQALWIEHPEVGATFRMPVLCDRD